jgi:hypothetical protein
MPVTSQNDIVSNFLSGQDAGKEVIDKVRVPDLTSYFNKVPASSKGRIKSESRKVIGMAALHTLPRDEVAATLLQTMERRGAVGFEWKVGKDSITVSFIEGFSQRELSEEDRQNLQAILLNVLKSRKSIVGIKWDFGQAFIEVSYIA